jgi:drug/metabolite transporter (DMT)-like permease
MRARTRKLALTEGIIAGVLFGTAAIFVRFLQDLDAFSIAFWRLIIACAALIALLALLRKKLDFKLVRRNLKDLLFLSFFLSLHFIFFVSAVKDTTILNATVLVNTTPIFSVFVSSFIFRLRPSRSALIGLAISFAGVCVIAYAETSTTRSGTFSPSLKGDIEALMAAFVESFYLGYGRKTRSQMSIMSIMLPIYALTAVIVGALSVPIIRKPLELPLNILHIIPLVGLGVLPTATAHTLYFSSLSNLKSFETATMALIEPIGATILGVVILSELPAPIFGLGAALILLGVIFVVIEKTQEQAQ